MLHIMILHSNEKKIETIPTLYVCFSILEISSSNSIVLDHAFDVAALDTTKNHDRNGNDGGAPIDATTLLEGGKMRLKMPSLK